MMQDSRDFYQLEMYFDPNVEDVLQKELSEEMLAQDKEDFPGRFKKVHFRRRITGRKKQKQKNGVSLQLEK